MVVAGGVASDDVAVRGTPHLCYWTERTRQSWRGAKEGKMGGLGWRK